MTLLVLTPALALHQTYWRGGGEELPSANGVTDHINYLVGHEFGHPAGWWSGATRISGTPGSSATWDWLQTSDIQAKVSCNNGGTWQVWSQSSGSTWFNTNGPQYANTTNMSIPACDSYPKYGTYAYFRWSDYNTWERAAWGEG